MTPQAPASVGVRVARKVELKIWLHGGEVLEQLQDNTIVVPGGDSM